MADIDNELEERGKVNRTLWFSAVILLAVVVAGVWGTVAFVDKQRERELQNWEIRLGIVANHRKESVDNWLAEQKKTIASLAENASLQVYLTQLVLETSENGSEISSVPEAGYLINLLNNQAVISGFWEPEEPEVRANVARPGRAGIGLTDRTGRLLVSSGSMPPMNPAIRAALAEADAGVSATIDVYEGLSGEPTMGFVHPVFAVQQDGDKDNVIGFIVGIRTISNSLFPLLIQPGDTLKTGETFLVREDNGLIEYISPLADGTSALKRTLSGDDRLAAAFVVGKPGGFAILNNYLGEEVLVTGRKINEAPWYLVREVSTHEALSETNNRLNVMLGVFLLLIIGVSGTLVAVWRHGTSLRAAELARKYKATAEHLREKSEFLRVVTDQQPTSIAVFDKDNHYTFANRIAAADADIDQDELIGRKITSILGKETSAKVRSMLDTARQENTQISDVVTLEDEGRPRVFKSDIIPLRINQKDPESVLAVMQDITDVVAERQRRESMLRSLVSTLVAFVDKRDPYSSNQSRRVAEVGVAIAEELGASDKVIQTVDIAGNLMNIGKILVPVSILTKTGELTDQEMEAVRDSLYSSADLLEGVKFDLPVAETLRQLQEHWDGSGQPRGLSGMAINEPARIIAVANAFVGMVSPRSYRQALDMSKAIEILMDGADKRFDRKPVSALINYLDNKGGRERWSHFAEMPEDLSAENDE
ncbi:HD domain-containing phosphohydrolase [Sneathiella chinensis]|uniref:HD-GYP domain-containing protein n=1 Tax=Sneathiella chinensis TaxID=349750 RepID=A0ABQ5U381_9PROT|nr:HD domain-containing phosphohydrolase [Sneathiella chinensis]GLQ06193.1 hypothetical protein GCM10007924_14140 [Sneathiella chinensis]